MQTNQFDLYLGQKVLVKETQSVYHSKYSGDIPVTDYDIKDEDTVMKKLEGEIITAGLRLRTWLPNTVGTMELRGDRVNVYITKQADGSFEISKINIG